jgi:hypothetical protein
LILSGDSDRIKKLIDQLAFETKMILKNAYELAYWSKGAADYSSILHMSPVEREMVAEFIEERMKAMKGNPFMMM